MIRRNSDTTRAAHDVPRRTRYVIAVILACALFAALWFVVRGRTADAPVPRVIVFYGYSTLEEPFQRRILPAFRELRRRETGEQVEFVASFAASGRIVEKILGRYPAEVAVLSSEIDAERLVGRLVARDTWRALPHGGALSRTPLALLVRPGNPHEVRGFEDLARTDIDVLLPDPATSGAGIWAILAAYGSELRRTGDPEQGVTLLRSIARNTKHWLPSACDARRRFVAGEGDVLLGYEQDLASCVSASVCDGVLVRPPSTIVTEQVVVRIERNISPGNRELVDAFIAYLWSPGCQATLRAAGFESVLDDERPPEATRDLFTLGDLGGAAPAGKAILEDTWRRKIRKAAGS